MLVKDYTKEFVDLKDVIVTKVENISNFKHNAKIVADKYHVVRQVTWAFEKENRVD